MKSLYYFITIYCSLLGSYLTANAQTTLSFQKLKLATNYGKSYTEDGITFSIQTNYNFYLTGKSTFTCDTCLFVPNTSHGAIKRWIIHKEDRSTFKFVGITLRDAGFGGRTTGLVKAIRNGMQIGDAMLVDFNGYITAPFKNNAFFDEVDEIHIEAIDLDLLVNRFTYDQPVPYDPENYAQVKSIEVVKEPTQQDPTIDFEVELVKNGLDIPTSLFEIKSSRPDNFFKINNFKKTDKGILVNVQQLLPGSASIRIAIRENNKNEIDVVKNGTISYDKSKNYFIHDHHILNFDSAGLPGGTSITNHGRTFTFSNTWSIQAHEPNLGLNESTHSLKNVTKKGPFTISMDSGYFMLDGLYLKLPPNNHTFNIKFFKDGNLLLDTKLAPHTTNTTINKGYLQYSLNTSSPLCDSLEFDFGNYIENVSLDRIEWHIDTIPPGNFTLANHPEIIQASNQKSINFELISNDLDCTYQYVYTSSGGGQPVLGTGMIQGPNTKIDNIDLSGLNQGTITLEVTLIDPSGNKSPTVTKLVEKTNMPKAINLILSNQSFSTIDPSNTIISEISVNFPQMQDGFNFRLIEGDGDTHNAQFNIIGNTLLAPEPIQFFAGEYSIRIQVTGETGNSYEKSFTIHVIDPLPQIRLIEMPSSSTYKIDDQVEFKVHTTLPVSVQGAPSIRLLLGNKEVQAQYVGGSGTETLLFSYQVQLGVEDLDGIQVIEPNIKLNGGSIKLTDSELPLRLSFKLPPNTSPILIDGIPPSGYELVYSHPSVHWSNFNFFTITIKNGEPGGLYQLTFKNSKGEKLETLSNRMVSNQETIRLTDLTPFPNDTLLVKLKIQDLAGNDGQDTLFTLVHHPNSPPHVITGGKVNTFVEPKLGPPTPVFIDQTITIIDENHTSLYAGEVKFARIYFKEEDRLGFQPENADIGNIIAQYNDDTNTLHLHSPDTSATIEQWTNALRSVTYYNISQNPNNIARLLNFRVHDGIEFGNYSNQSVFILSTNNAPILMGLDSTSVTYTEGNQPIRLNPLANATIYDPDNSHFENGILTVALLNGVAAEDVLTIYGPNQGDKKIYIQGSYLFYGFTQIGSLQKGPNGIDLIINLYLNATQEVVEAILHNITYVNLNDLNPSTQTRTIRITLNDGQGDTSLPNDIELTILAVNHAPVNHVPQQQTIRQNSTLTFSTTLGNALTVSDVDIDENALEVHLTASHGTLSLNDTTGLQFSDGTGSEDVSMRFTGILTNVNRALEGMTFSPSQNYNGLTTIQLITDDLGSTGMGGPLRDTSRIDINILPIEPVILSVGSTTPNGLYKIGDHIELTILFDQKVWLQPSVQTPSILLATGSQIGEALYRTGSGTETLIFDYQVKPGENSQHLDYQSMHAFNLKGGSLKNILGDDAILILPDVKSAQSLAGQHHIIIDGLAPNVISVELPADGYYKAHDTLYFIVHLNDSLNIQTHTGIPYLELEIGTDIRQAYYQPSAASNQLTFRYIVQPGDMDEDGISIQNQVLLGGSTIRDRAGNDADLSLQPVPNPTGILINTQHPSLQLTTSVESPVLGSFEVLATFSEVIFDFTVTDIQIQNAHISNLKSEDQKHFTFSVHPKQGGTVTLEIGADVAHNIAGNGNKASNTLKVQFHAPIMGISLPSKQFEYNGEAHALRIEGDLPKDARVEYHKNHQSQVGTYSIIATISGENYQTLELTSELIIMPKALTIQATNKSKTYGKNLTLSNADFSSSGLVSGDLIQKIQLKSEGLVSHANAGQYPIFVGLAEGKGLDNYTITYISGQLTVHPAEQNIILTSPGTLPRNAGTIPMHAKASSGLPVTLSIDDDEIASLTSDGQQLHIKRLGTIRITASQPGNSNYLAAKPVTVTLQIINDKEDDFPVRINQAVSPNGDGINDYWMIEGIRDFEENKVSIFSQSGQKVTEIKNYNNRDRVFKANQVRDGTYYYLLEIKVGNQWKIKKGFFVVKRQ